MKLQDILLEDRANHIAQSLSTELVARYKSETNEDVAAREVVNRLMKADPSQQSKYIGWVAQMYAKGQFKITEVTRIKHELAEFDRVNAKLEAKSISQYSTVNQLCQALAPHHHDDIKEGLDNNRERMYAESDVIHKGNDFTILSPRTEAAAAYFGRGTKWSTASSMPGAEGEEESSKFNEYHSQAPVYIMMDTKGNKYQMWFPSFSKGEKEPEILGAQGQEVDINRLFKQYPELLNLLREKTTFKEWSNPGDAKSAMWYAQNVIGGRWPEGEASIAKDGESAVNYAAFVVGGRWSEAEATIIRDPACAIWYAQHVLKERWPAAESSIMSSPHHAINYALNVIKGRWPEAEKSIKGHPHDAKKYQKEVLRGAEWPDDVDTSRHTGGKKEGTDKKAI